jgi:hypothetical protein
VEISQIVYRLDILPDLAEANKRLCKSALPVEVLLDGTGASHLNIATVIDQVGECLSRLDQPVRIVLRCSYDELFAKWMGHLRSIRAVPVIVRADMSNVKAFDIDECNKLEDVRDDLARSLVRLELVNRDNPQIIVSLLMAGHLPNYCQKPLTKPSGLKGFIMGSWVPYSFWDPE